MKQETMNNANPSNTNFATFQQKSTALSLIITSSATLYYFANMWPMRPLALASDVLPAGYGSLVLSTIALIIGAQIVLQIVLAVGSGNAPTATQHEKLASLKAKRLAYGVLTLGMFVAIGSVFLEELTPFCTANLAILSFAIAEVVRLAAQLFYTRP